MFRISRSSRAFVPSLYSRPLTQPTRSITKKTSITQSLPEEEDIPVADSPSLIKNAYKWLQDKHGSDAIRVSSPEYNRWLQVAPPVATMLCLGGMYSWSLLNGPLTHDIGVITQVATDWSLSSVVPVFGTLVLFNGTAGALLGKWIDKSGPRISYAVGGLMYGGGLMLGSLGVTTHILPLLYLGYGVIGGLGHGICYISCISTLIQFFPDKRGLASGMAVMGLGGGAILSTPIIDRLLTHNFIPPQYINENILSSATNVVENGKSFIHLSSDNHDGLVEVAKLDCSDLLSSGFSPKIMTTLMDGGTYVLGSGSSGAAATMLVVGAAYLTTILTSSMFTKLPRLKVENSEEKCSEKAMTVEEAFRTPQFWFMWISFSALSSTGMGCISTAKTMMSEVFGGTLPLIVTSSFASTYVMAISGSNLFGRLGWGGVSDRIGQFKTYLLFGMSGTALYAAIPYYVSSVVDTPSMAPLCLFYGSTLLLFSYFGGGFSVMPSYEAKLFGAKNVGAIHGRMMTAVAASGMIGPMIVTRCRESTYRGSVHDLVEHVDPQRFSNEFGASINDLDTLIDNKVVTINKLMHLIPDDMNIIDPTPFLYDSTMYAMSGCMAICATANIMIKRFGIPKQMLQNSKL